MTDLRQQGIYALQRIALRVTDLLSTLLRSYFAA